MDSILHHQLWPQLREYFRAEAYGRDTNHQGYTRRRLEVIAPHDYNRRTWLLTLRAPCVCCGRMIYPIRERRGGGLYYAATCPLISSPRCSKGRDASDEYKRVVEYLEHHPPPNQQQSLF